MACDRRAEWMLNRRFGGDASVDVVTTRELAAGTPFARADIVLEAAIERGRLWGREPPPLDVLLGEAPNPSAPTLEEVPDAELSPEERDRFLAFVRRCFEACELTGRHAVAYLRAHTA